MVSRSILVLLLTAGCSSAAPCDTVHLAPLARAPSFAVVLSDYASSAIALLDADGMPITEAWLDSGTRASGLTAGLSGDVVLVDSPVPSALALLERFNAERLTLATFATGEVRQLRLVGDDPERPSGSSPNAQDVLAIDARHALVSRANPSRDPRTPELARGNDVVVVDHDAGRVVARIDLEADDTAPDGTPIFARPTSLVPLAHPGGARRVLVGLQRLSASFMVSGDGALAVIDPDARTCTARIALDGLSGCHVARAIPGAPEQAMILCTGDAFTGEEERRRKAGVVRVALDPDGRVTVDHVWRAIDHPGGPSPTTGLVPLDATRAVYVSDPRGDDGLDAIVHLDLSEGSTSIVLEADGSFVLGSGALSADGRLLLVPDASARGLHRFDVGDDARVTPRDLVPLPTCRTLPAREVRAL